LFDISLSGSGARLGAEADLEGAAALGAGLLQTMEAGAALGAGDLSLAGALEAGRLAAATTTRRNK
jgi:hypothetical protein